MHTYIYTYTPEKDRECPRSYSNGGGVCTIHTFIHTYTYKDTCMYIRTHTHNTTIHKDIHTYVYVRCIHTHNMCTYVVFIHTIHKDIHTYMYMHTPDKNAECLYIHITP